MKEHGRIHLGQPILGGGVVIQFPAARGAGKDYNERTMRPDTSTTLSTIGDFRLGDWEVRPQHNKLVSESEGRHLEPKAMDLLVFLAASGSEVVSKNALIDAVWEGRFISEGTLTNTIAELRRALGDDARNPRYIETIPKRGYRLVAAVELASSSIENEALDPGRPRKAVVVIVAVGILLALTAALWVVLQTRNRPLDPELVLVSPFVNRTGDDEFDVVALQARDRLVSKLSESRLVAAVPAAFGGPGDAIDELRAAGFDSGAGLAIGGTLYLHEGEIEVRAGADVHQHNVGLEPLPPVQFHAGDRSVPAEDPFHPAPHHHADPLALEVLADLGTQLRVEHQGQRAVEQLDDSELVPAGAGRRQQARHLEADESRADKDQLAGRGLVQERLDLLRVMEGPQDEHAAEVLAVDRRDERTRSGAEDELVVGNRASVGEADRLRLGVDLFGRTDHQLDAVVGEHGVRVHDGFGCGQTGHDMRQRSPDDKALFRSDERDVHLRHQLPGQHGRRRSDSATSDDDQLLIVFHDYKSPLA